MFSKHRDLETAHEADIVPLSDAENMNGNVNVEIEFEDSFGAAILGLIALALLFALLRVMGQNRALVNQLRGQ